MSSQNKTEYLKLSQFENDDIPQWRTDYTGDMAIIDKAVKELTDISEELKKSVSDGKTLVATAITEKGVATEPTDSADVMAENIRNIPSGNICGLYVLRAPWSNPYGVIGNIYGVLPLSEKQEVSQ